MKKEIADKWVQALRSNKYEQAKERLRTDDGYCCLGVLTDIYLNEHNREWTGSLQSYSMLPLYVKDWAGMADHEGLNTDRRDSLWRLNDHASWSFKQLADLIEERWEHL